MIYTEVAQRRSEKYGRQLASQKFIQIKFVAGALTPAPANHAD
jgi:hypothetical protein